MYSPLLDTTDGVNLGDRVITVGQTFDWDMTSKSLCRNTAGVGY